MLPPLLPPTLKPPPLPPIGSMVLSKPGQQEFRELSQPRTTVTGADWVQVTLENGPDDNYARVEFAAAGVEMWGASLMPRRGTMHLMVTTKGHAVYRWRC